MRDLAKLDVCLVAGTLGLGGAERQLFYIVQALVWAGTRPRLLCLTAGEFWEAKVRELGVSVTCFGEHAWKLCRLSRIINVLRKHPPDILQSQHFYTNLYVAAAARAIGAREVGAVRNDVLSEVGASGRLLGRLSLRVPRLIAANSRAGIRNAIALGTPVGKLHFLPNVVDTEQFRPAPPRRPGPVRVLAAGMRRQKRVDRFLDLLAAVRRCSNVEFKAIIIGDGPERPRLEERARALGLSPEVVEFKGTIVVGVADYRDADILALTSDFEGTPNVVLEAMASGLPVVASRVGGVPELVQHGVTGFLADAHDTDAMADALLRLMTDAPLRQRMGIHARQYVEAHHSPAVLPNILSEIYSAALS